MSKQRPIWICFSMGLVLAMGSIVIAQSPVPPQAPVVPSPSAPFPTPQLGQGAPDEESPGTPRRREEAAERSIQAALDGTASDGQAADPLLDDVLQIIRQRGSILDGSVLDPARDPQSITDEPQGIKNETMAIKIRAAESLLRSARLLEKIAPLDQSPSDLINSMRKEASKLLRQAISD